MLGLLLLPFLLCFVGDLSVAPEELWRMALCHIQEMAVLRCLAMGWRWQPWRGSSCCGAGSEVRRWQIRRGSLAPTTVGDGSGGGRVPGLPPAGELQRKRLLGPLLRSTKALRHEDAPPLQGLVVLGRLGPAVLRRRGSLTTSFVLVWCKRSKGPLCDFFVCWGVLCCCIGTTVPCAFVLGVSRWCGLCTGCLR